jgi:hypothetical protein
MQSITYYLSDYNEVLVKTQAIVAIEGEVVSVEVAGKTFNDGSGYHKGDVPICYKVVAKLPMSAAIRFC